MRQPVLFLLDTVDIIIRYDVLVWQQQVTTMASRRAHCGAWRLPAVKPTRYRATTAGEQYHRSRPSIHIAMTYSLLMTAAVAADVAINIALTPGADKQ